MGILFPPLSQNPSPTNHPQHDTSTQHQQTWPSRLSSTLPGRAQLWMHPESRPQRLLSNPAASTSTSTMTLSQRLLRTSALSAPARRVSDTLALPSTASSLNSCSREVTSPVATALVASPSTVRSSPMRTSPESTPSQDFSPWPTPDQTPTAPSSSLPPLSPAGSMASTLSSVRSLMSNPWLPSRLSRLPDPAAERSTTTRSQPSSSLVSCRFAFR